MSEIEITIRVVVENSDAADAISAVNNTLDGGAFQIEVNDRLCHGCVKSVVVIFEPDELHL